MRKKTPIQKTYEIKEGSDSLNVEFLGANKQFDWIEISIVKAINIQPYTIAITERWLLN